MELLSAFILVVGSLAIWGVIYFVNLQIGSPVRGTPGRSGRKGQAV